MGNEDITGIGKKKDYNTAFAEMMEQANRVIEQNVSALPKCMLCRNLILVPQDCFEYYDKSKGLVRVCKSCAIKCVDKYFELRGDEK